ncbi:MAG: hypothetical protein LBL07_06285 [Tannerella sp.]|jgi:TonB-dependent SusC/RagA subfamily outer membrane receptor|nr:hypothetical protein [Tannerella sp.]
MEIYLLKYGIWIALFWSVYWFFFRRETFFGFNRFFLLSGLALSFVLASCQYRYSVILNLPPATFPGNSPVQEAQPGFVANRIPVVIGIYLAGVLVLLLHNLNGLNKIRNMIRKQSAHRRTSPSVVEVAEIQSSFSFFGYIFMDKSANLSEVERRLILEHETAHVEQRHWMDLLLAQIICILQWFNPFAWLYLQAVKENHEFLADRAVLRRGNSPAVYHAALINCALKTPVFAFTNSFTHYNNKFKRIAMMKKNVSKPAKKLAVLLLVPAFAVFLSAFAKPEYSYSIPVLTEQDKTAADDSVAVIPFGARVKDLSNKVQKDVPFWINGKDKPSDIVLYVDGKEVTSISDLNPHDIHSFTVMKDKKAMELYGKKNAILIITKKHAQETGLEDSAAPAGETKDINDKTPNRKIKSISMDGNNVLVDFDGDDGKKTLIVIDGKENSDTVKSSETNEIKYIINNIKYTTCEDKNIIDQLSNINKQEPLIVVDGEEYSGNIKDIDVNDIKSFSILKDSTATTHYGEKGKNGVIIITTKASQEAEKQNP